MNLIATHFILIKNGLEQFILFYKPIRRLKSVNCPNPFYIRIKWVTIDFIPLIRTTIVGSVYLLPSVRGTQ